MNCEIARRLMEANDPALEGHMLSCPSCMIGAHARYYEAPPGLAGRIARSLPRDQSAPAAWRWFGIAAALLLAISAIWNFVLLRSRPDHEMLIADDVVSAHIRSLSGTHLLDVPSSDQHTVKPWFNGKLDFSPTVKEVDGFPLLGGRLEYFAGRPAAALIYERGKHIINLFTWPSATPTTLAPQSRNGYHLQQWSADGMTFWVVSDLNEAELGQFVSLYRRR